MTPRNRERRFRRLKEMGCWCCGITGAGWVRPDIHHLNLCGQAGRKRRGDAYTIPLCTYHHTGHEVNGRDIDKDPSLAGNSKRFREVYGTDDEILYRVNEVIIQLERQANRPTCGMVRA